LSTLSHKLRSYDKFLQIFNYGEAHNLFFFTLGLNLGIILLILIVFQVNQEQILKQVKFMNLCDIAPSEMGSTLTVVLRTKARRYS
jgi:hypothetical protein